MRPDPRDTRRSRTILVLLVLASFTLITLDARRDLGSPVDPMRSAAGEIFGPIEQVLAAAARPVAGVPEHFADVSELRAENESLREENLALLDQVHTFDLDRNRLTELEALLGLADQGGYQLVPARVIGLGPAQSFSRTATIDVGTHDGVTADMTVVAGEGLVGRVLRASTTTSTVLLIVDSKSTVGGRVASTSELGFADGGGASGDDETQLALEMVDPRPLVQAGDVVATWGSEDGPFVAGVPIGEVVGVTSAAASQSTTAVVSPFVDFTALDVVGVILPPRDGDLRAPVSSAPAPAAPSAEAPR